MKRALQINAWFMSNGKTHKRRLDLNSVTDRSVHRIMELAQFAGLKRKPQLCSVVQFHES